MNEDNINKLIAYVRDRTKKTKDWGDTDQCFSGITERALGLEPLPYSEGGHVTRLETALGLTEDQACSLFSMHDSDEDGQYHNFCDFEALSLEDQNAALVAVLTKMRDTGKVVWESFVSRETS